MGKALLIKNVDFDTNKLGTVTISNPVPCTGITLSDSTATMQEIGSTIMLTAYVEPANTTQNIEWATSDEGIAVVTGGTVAQMGVGSVTITATCGTQTATCTITCTQTYVQADLVHTPGGGLIKGANQDYVAYQSNNRYMYVALDTNATGGYQVATDVPGVYAIPIPYGATECTASLPATTGTSSGNMSSFNRNYVNTKVKQSGASTYESAKALLAVTDVAGGSTPTLPSGKTSFTIDLSEAPEGADAMIFNLIAMSGSKAEDWTGTVGLTFA